MGDKEENISNDKREKVRYLFLNRSILCFFEILVLWLTSLSIIVSIVGYIIPNPTLTFVENECISSYQTVEIQRLNYASCVRVQSRQCLSNLQFVTHDELLRISKNEASNANKVSLLKMKESNCSSYYEVLSNLLKAWVSVNPLIGLVYNDSCSAQNRSYIQDLIGDYSSSNSVIVASSISYSENSDSRVNRLVSYGVSTRKYDTQYISKKLHHTSEDILSIMNNTITIQGIELNRSSSSVRSIFEEAMNCFNISSLVKCKYGTSSAEIYGKCI